MLYNAYGMIEWLRGNKETANGVFCAALTMSKSVPEKDDSIFLWKTWAWLSLQDGDNNTALCRLLSIADGIPDNTPSIGPAILLKTKQHLSSNRDYYLSSGNVGRAIMYAECIALLEYLSSKPGPSSELQVDTQGNIAAAQMEIEKFSQTLIERKLGASSSHEIFLQSSARLLV
jgi:hypothetical protein